MLGMGGATKFAVSASQGEREAGNRAYAMALLLAGLAAGSALPGRLGLSGNPDLYALALGLLLAAGAFLALHLTERRRRSSGRYAPKVVRIERLCQQCGASRENNRERQDANHGNEIGQHEL